jgi:excisionase family DNA binding protein
MREDDLLPIGQAAAVFGIPRIKIGRWIRAGRLVAHHSGRDERQRLVRRGDVAALLQPAPLAGTSETTKKRVA